MTTNSYALVAAVMLLVVLGTNFEVFIASTILYLLRFMKLPKNGIWTPLEFVRRFSNNRRRAIGK